MKYCSQFNSTFENSAEHTDKIINILKSEDSAPPKKMLFYIDFVLRELLNNAVEHGNGNDARKIVKYCVDSDAYKFKIIVCDEGEGFDLQPTLQQIECDESSRLRNRGLCTAIKIGWKISTEKGFVEAEIQYGNNFFNEGDKIMLTTVNENEAIFKIRKDITANNVRELIAEFEIDRESIKNVKKLSVDMSEVFVIDSIGITFLIGLYKSVSNEGVEIVLSGCNNSILEIMKIMKLDDLFKLN